MGHTLKIILVFIWRLNLTRHPVLFVRAEVSLVRNEYLFSFLCKARLFLDGMMFSAELYVI